MAYSYKFIDTKLYHVEKFLKNTQFFFSHREQRCFTYLDIDFTEVDLKNLYLLISDNYDLEHICSHICFLVDFEKEQIFKLRFTSSLTYPSGLHFSIIVEFMHQEHYSYSLVQSFYQTIEEQKCLSQLIEYDTENKKNIKI